jgi:hypothetical protein
MNDLDLIVILNGVIMLILGFISGCSSLSHAHRVNRLPVSRF